MHARHGHGKESEWTFGKRGLSSALSGSYGNLMDSEETECYKNSKTHNQLRETEMKRTVKVCLILLLGVLVTLLSGLYGRDFKPAGGIDVRYGLPLAWHGEQGPVYLNSPRPTVWYSWENFTYDVIAWCVLFGIVALIVRRRK
jgi:hypothetical protein